MGELHRSTGAKPLSRALYSIATICRHLATIAKVSQHNFIIIGNLQN